MTLTSSMEDYMEAVLIIQKAWICSLCKCGRAIRCYKAFG